MNSSMGCGRPPDRIGIVAEARYGCQIQPRGMVEALRRMSNVELIDVQRSDHLERCDVVVARGRSEHVLDLLAWAERRGVRTVNPSGSVRAVLDKVEMHHRLLHAGVRVPRTWTGPIQDLRRQLRGHRGRLVIKPVLGDNCRDVKLLDDGGQLAETLWSEPRAIVQEYVDNDGFDIKLYGIGERVWVVRKPSPLLASKAEAVQLVTTPGHVRLARRCANAFGLDLYGVDCVQTSTGLVVIEVNDFPNYSGLEWADLTLAEFVVAQIDAQLTAMAS